MLILYLWVQIRTIWGGIKCVCKQFVKRQLFNTVRLCFRKSESSHRVDCFREDAKKPFSWVRVRTQHRKGQKGSMKLRKNSGSKKREKSLEISRFLVFPRPDLNWLVIMAGIAGLEPAKCKSQSLVPYRLGYIPICLCLDILSHIKSIVNIKIPPKRDFCLYITFCAHSAFQARRNRFCQAL